MSDNRILYIAEIDGDTRFQNVTLEIREKLLLLSFRANRSDIRNGIFGFDKFNNSFKNTCVSSFSQLEEEYKPLMIYEEKYYPVWISIRKGQTVTLELDVLNKKNYIAYKDIKFESNLDFTFEPANLKDSKEVKITCNNTSPEPLQLKIEGDGEIVGAINFFYPEPKTLALDWRFVELIGNKTDEKTLIRKVKLNDLNKLIRKAFNPLLIDIKIESSEANISDLSFLKDEMEKKTRLIVFNEVERHYYINDIRKRSFTGYIQKYSKASDTALTIYFINMRCINPSEVIKSQNEEGYSVTAGFSPTGTGIAYGVLDSGDLIKEETIIHELLHAVGLQHTFSTESKHQFKTSRTDNYMDYYNSKEFTYCWQWQIVQAWVNSNNQFLYHEK